MKIPPPAALAGRRAAIGMIRLVAPSASLGGVVSTCPASVARARLVDPLYRRLSCCSSSHLIPNHTSPCLRGAFARAAELLFLCGAYAPLLLPSPAASRGAAGLLLFLRPPREGWAERREAHLYSHRACEARLPC